MEERTYSQEDPQIWKPIFCFKTNPIDKETFISPYKVEFSPEGSNRRDLVEEDTIYYLEVFLQDIEGNSREGCSRRKRFYIEYI